MPKPPAIVYQGADLRQADKSVRAAVDTGANGRHAALDRLLVLGVAAVAVGVMLVSQGLRPAQSAADRVPPTDAVQDRVERRVPALNAHPVAMPPADRIPPTPAPRSALTGATSSVSFCSPRLDLDHDLRLVLAALALQRRRTLHATVDFVPPDTRDIPASVRARAKASVTRAEASPEAARPSNDPGC